jgi:GNAT superfamily N-acetyltransferase
MSGRGGPGDGAASPSVPGDIEIRPLRAEEVDQAAGMLARAFRDDPGSIIIEPDPSKREAANRTLFSVIVRHAVAVGEVTAAIADGRILGIATWLPPGRVLPTEDELVAAGLLDAVAAVPEAATRMGPMVAFLDEQMGRAISGPHWRLEFFGVERELQGSGLGSRLLEPGHARADAAGELAYLETFTAKNVAWYSKRGWDVVIEGIVPGTDTPVWGLIRQPRPARLARPLPGEQSA